MVSSSKQERREFRAVAVIEHETVSRPAKEPRQIFQRPPPPLRDFCCGNIVPAGSDSTSDTLGSQLRRAQCHINKPEVSACLQDPLHEWTVFGSAQHRLDPNRFASVDRFVHSLFNHQRSLDKRFFLHCQRSVVKALETTLYQKLTSDFIGIYKSHPANQATQRNAVRPDNRGLAGSIGTGNEPESWLTSHSQARFAWRQKSAP